MRIGKYPVVEDWPKHIPKPTEEDIKYMAELAREERFNPCPAKIGCPGISGGCKECPYIPA